MIDAKGEEEHPMVPVPDAIRMVLLETARVLLEGRRTPEERISVDTPWQELLGKTIATDVRMEAPGYPPYNASVMDGYAIRTMDYPTANEEGITILAVVGKVYAGAGTNNFPVKSVDGLPAALYVTTGAIIPTGFDCVVPVEDVKRCSDDDKIEVLPYATIQEGAWIRKIGCDIQEGTVVLPDGYVLDPVGLGLMKQAGVDHVHIKKPVQVGILSTGNELIRKNEERNQTGRIPDVNGPVLLSLLSTFGTCNPIDLGIGRDDDIELLTKKIVDSLETCEIIITTGGISMGECDIVEEILVKRLGGTLHFGRMHMKPGKPTTFVTLFYHGSTKLIFAMPGNPVSAIVCTEILVYPCLELLFHGAENYADTHSEILDDRLHRIVSNAWVHPEINATIVHATKLDKERPEYHRVTLRQLNKGVYEATSTGVQQSSRLMSLRGAQGLLLLPQGTPGGKMTSYAGEQYPVLMLHSKTSNKVQVRDSVHLNNFKKSLRIAVVYAVSPTSKDMDSLEHVAFRVQTALCSSISGQVMIVSSSFFATEPDKLLPFCCSLNINSDVICVVCQDYKGSFRRHLDICSNLRQGLSKIADAMALQARQGAVSDNASAAILETIVGFVPEHGAMLICVSERGMDGALQNVHGLLKHALKVDQGIAQQS